MRVILVPMGSAGDIHPFVALGKGMAARGHAVTMLANEHYGRLAADSGFEFAAIGTEAEYRRMLDDPRLWHPTQGTEFVIREGFLPRMRPVYEAIAARYRPGETFVVASTLAFGARVAQDKLGVPTVTVHLQPAVLPSLHRTPEFGGLGWLTGLPRPVKRIAFEGIDWTTDRMCAPEINRFRASLGLPPVRKIMKEWLHSPLATLGLFPDWFAPPQPDWPPQVRLTGFPLFDEDQRRPVTPAIESFLKDGPPPVIFTAGSAMRHARAMFEAAVQACAELGCRGLLLNQFPDQIPADLPPFVASATYAPFGRVFPRAAAVLHHGGIGTTGQALAAGIPQLVTPFAHDQFDNASLLERLGVGITLPAARFGRKRLVAALERVLHDAGMRSRARALAPRLDGPAAVTRACEILVELGAQFASVKT